MKYTEITPLLHIWRWSWSRAGQHPVCPQAPLAGWKVCIISLAGVFMHKSWNIWGDSHSLPAIPVSAVPHSVLTPYSTHHAPKNVPAVEMALSSQQHDLVTSGNGRAGQKLLSPSKFSLWASPPCPFSLVMFRVLSTDMSKAMSHLCLEPSSSQDGRSSSGSWLLEGKAFLVNVFM